MAFVTSFIGSGSVALSAFRGKHALSPRPVRVQSGRVMMAASRSVPFLERPPKLDGSLPGDVGFDPLGFSNYFDLNFLRESEVKHCRICMLAIVGWFFPEVVYHLPNEMYSAVNPLDAPGKVGFFPMFQIFLGIMFLEAAAWEKVYDGKSGGNYGFDPLGLAKSPEARKRMELAEVKNGRLAMCAIGGAIHHSLLTHQGMFEQIQAQNWFSAPYNPLLH